MGERGVNVVGRFMTTVGSTIAGFAVIEALRRRGVPMAMLSLEDDLADRRPDAFPDLPLVGSFEELPYRTTLILDSVLMLEAYVNACRGVLADHHLSTVLYWELDYLPRRWRATFEAFDSILSPTAFVRDALRRSFGLESALVPVTPLHGMARNAVRPIDRPFTFLMHFDVLSTLERKNPTAAIDAFTRAFGDRDDVRLLIKAWESPPWLLDRDYADALTRRHPNVSLLFDHLTYEGTLALVRDCDAYVSAHRTEGLGLGMLEAMSFGKPVVATDYAGGRDFLDAFCGEPVPYALAPVNTPQSCYAAEALGAQAYWADVDVAAAAAAMRRVKDDHARYRAVSAAALARYEARKADFLAARWLGALGLDPDAYAPPAASAAPTAAAAVAPSGASADGAPVRLAAFSIA